MIQATLVSLCCILATVCGRNEPTITQDIKAISKPVGATAELACYVQYPNGRPNQYKVRWTRQRETHGQTLTTNDKISTDFNGFNNGLFKYEVSRTLVASGSEADPNSNSRTYIFTLKINRLVKTDKGKYACQLVIPGSSSKIKETILTVSVSPQISQDSTITMISTVNGTASFTCTAFGSPRPTITWHKSNQETMPANHIKKTEVQDEEGDPGIESVLTLVNLAKEDGGPYKCTASNNVPSPATRIYSLLIQYQPNVKAYKPKVQAYQGQRTATVSCRVQSNPSPSVIWYYAGKDEAAATTLIGKLKDTRFRPPTALRSGAKYLSTESKTFFDLIINQIEANDFGYYVCAGKNRHGVGAAYVNMYQTNQKNTIKTSIREQIGDNGENASPGRTAVSMCLIITTVALGLSISLFRP